ncbi:MAG: hypothetical protein K2Y22_14400 [Candidatus Obscuribacterales bacterium]|nr:hypothetical protein [Candidatus Obscuribacterales bacterium]
MRKFSKAVSCCFALALIAMCALLTGCTSSTLNPADYDQAAKECGDSFLNSMPEGQNVFIDPQLLNHEYAPMSLRGVEQRLARLEDKAAGKVRFLVIAKQINEPASAALRQYSRAGLTPAQLLSPLMLERAKRSESFPDDSYVLIVLTRYKDSVQSTCMETTCSPALLAVYPTLENLLNRGLSNNLQSNAEKYLPNPVDQAILLVAQGITDEVAKVEKSKSDEADALRKAEEEKQKAAEAEKKALEEQQRKASDSTWLWCIWGGLLAGAALTLCGVGIFKLARKRN